MSTGAGLFQPIRPTIKGAARGIGAFDMADAAARCEPIDLANKQDASAAIAILRTHSLAVQAFIKAYLAN